jgi:hypothetical protein
LLKAIELKALEIYNRIGAIARGERGQTAAEYVAVTAVAVLIAMLFLYAVMGEAINNSVEAIATRLTNFVNNTQAPAPPAPAPGP